MVRHNIVLLLADMMLYMLEQGLWVTSFINTSTLHDFDRKRGSQQGKASGFTLRKHYCIHVNEDKQEWGTYLRQLPLVSLLLLHNTMPLKHNVASVHK